MVGYIKRIYDLKGFGFIIPDDAGPDIFFHARSMADGTRFEDLKEGDEVEFVVRESAKGWTAFNLKVTCPITSISQ